MFLYSNIIGSCFLALEGMLAWIAFGTLTNPCVEPSDWNKTHPNEPFKPIFPCATAGLYNENFLNINGLG